MAALLCFLLGFGLIFFSFFLLAGGITHQDATRTFWIVAGGALFALGVGTVYMVATDWLQSRKRPRGDNRYSDVEQSDLGADQGYQ